MKVLSYILPVVLLLFGLSCEKISDWPINDNIAPLLVVEGFVTNRPELNYVKLSLPVASPGNEPSPVSGAFMAILSGQDTLILSESSSEAGVYTPVSPLIGVVNRAYRLYIRVGGYEFISSPTWMAPVNQLKELRYYSLESLPVYYVINPLQSDEPSFIKYRVDYPDPSNANDTLTKLFYSYTLRTIDVNQFFKPDSETLIFPEGSRVIRTKYSLAPDHEKYIRSLLSETEWKGGWFDVLPGNLHTNMSQGAAGYFGACSTLRDTIFLQ